MIDDLFKHLIFYPVVIVLAALVDMFLEVWLQVLVVGFFWCWIGWTTTRERRRLS
jgi:hypothetical protein